MAVRHQVILDEPLRENRFPTLINRGDGQLLLVFHTSPVRPQGRHMDIAMEVRLMRSADDGETWSPPELLITHDGQVSPTHPPHGEGDKPAVVVPYFHWVVLPQGETELLRSRVPGASVEPSDPCVGDPYRYAASEDRYYGVVGAVEGVYVTRSQDGGQSWSHRIRVKTGAFLWGGTRDLPARAPSGRLFLPVYGRRSQDTADVAFTVFSDDEGVTWSRPVVIAEDPEGRVEYQEPAMVALSDEHILATYRIDRHEGVEGRVGDEVLCNESKDGGKTWTEPRPIGVWGHPTHMIRLKDGPIVCVYGHRRRPYGIRAVLSQDNGVTWLADRELILRDDGLCSDAGQAATDIGYPFVTQLGDGSLMAVYYFDVGRGQRFLAATYFGVEDFLDAPLHR